MYYISTNNKNIRIPNIATIGRSSKSTLIINLPSVQPTHVKIDCNNKTIVPSGNDVYLNNKLLTQHKPETLKVNDKIKVKNVEFVLLEDVEIDNANIVKVEGEASEGNANAIRVEEEAIDRISGSDDIESNNEKQANIKKEQINRESNSKNEDEVEYGNKLVELKDDVNRGDDICSDLVSIDNIVIENIEVKPCDENGIFEEIIETKVEICGMREEENGDGVDCIVYENVKETVVLSPGVDVDEMIDALHEEEINEVKDNEKKKQNTKKKSQVAKKEEEPKTTKRKSAVKSKPKKTKKPKK